jgi:membrane protease YdiL (CAAX protease family)
MMGEAMDSLESQRPEESSRVPDPGVRGPLRWMLWVVVAVLFGLVVMQQQAPSSASQAQQSQSAGQSQQAAAPDPLAETAESEMFSAMTRTMVRVGVAMKKSDPAAPVGQFVAALAEQGKSGTAGEGAIPSRDTLRLAVAAGELQDAIEANRFLDKVEADENAPAEMKADAAALRLVYSGKKSEITEEQRKGLVDRHGKLGEIALSFGDPETGRRAELLSGGMAIALGMMLLVTVVIGGVLSGFVLLAVLAVRLGTGKLTLRFVPPAPGGTVFLETFGLFVGGFLLLKVVGEVLMGAAIQRGETWPIYVSLGSQWLLTPILLWPMVRGMGFSRWKSAVGLSCPRGVWREIAAGVVGYLAGLPLFLLAALVTVLLMALRSAVTGESGPPKNPVVDLLQLGDLKLQLLLAFMAIVWAPINEEILFRGALYRHLRGGLAGVLAAVITALFFGFMHGYDPLMLLPVMTLGFNFALMREWRGGIVASMTAHALHNAFSVTAMIVVLQLLK